MTSAAGESSPPAGRLPAGQRIASRYVVESVIGEGAHGVVYLCRRDEGDKVALKVLHRHLCGDPQIGARFHREATILARLEGEHIVRLLEFIEEDGLLMIALEYVEGTSLEALLAERAPLDKDQAIEITLQVCAALGVAHANGIVHRDLKPANVLVERASGPSSGRPGPVPLFVKVVDFGLGKVMHGEHGGTNLTEQGMIFGTPEYMAPEQARGEDADARSDLYAAGVMLFEMATGEVPFHGKGPLGVMKAHLTEPPPSPRARRAGSSISPSLEAVILRALAKDPAERYSSARDFAQAIASARDATRVVAPDNLTGSQALAMDDTDLHVVVPGLSDSAAKRAKAIDMQRFGADALATTAASEQPPSTLESPGAVPSPEPPPESAGPRSGDAPPRGKLVWLIVAVIAAAVGVVLGAVIGAR